ncbi:Alpha/Beta hydrolase protein [Talaromyces proteolyticus]|uniref:Carboxylic ester hydrolase n=1 Tax=Talaromyces proteolyticus TaxID=1131652 RepID=A0AAD4KJM6_9EURO|nr:Alpha/Beta hydrolase protein [Talaromyces proteolyticus]KAH8692593.1 Alpha/Beta hydrolase protein [Talaromyces proteolyticus]
MTFDSHLLLLFCALLGVVNAANPVVKLPYASYKGAVNNDLGYSLGYASFALKKTNVDRIISYRGIHYASPPTGDLRWQPPVPIQNTEQQNSVIDAASSGPTCPLAIPSWFLSGPVILEIAAGGGTVGFPALQESEDCLLLDVLIPSNPQSDNLPVIVQIHGGGYTLGFSELYAGDNFVSESKGSVIYVEIQYRLGPLGFLSSQELRQNGTANAGILDQRLALEWVQKYISYFGGDPSKVTIWGGSAGGGSVVAQLMLNGGEEKPPFWAAIAGNASHTNAYMNLKLNSLVLLEYPWIQPYHDDEALETQYNAFLKVANCSSLPCLRALSSSDITNVVGSVMSAGYNLGEYGFGDFWFGPSIDGRAIKGLPTDEIAAGRFSRVPLLTDHEEFEGVLFTNMSIHSEDQVEPDLQDVWPAANASFFERLFNLYPLSDFSGNYFQKSFFLDIFALMPTLTLDAPFYQRQAILGDAFIGCPTRLLANTFQKNGLPIWKMTYNYGIAIHSSTQPYLLRASNDVLNPQLARTIKDYFLSFALARDPNAISTVAKPMWVQYDTNSTVLGIDSDAKPTLVADVDDSEKCEFLLSQGHVLRN